MPSGYQRITASLMGISITDIRNKTTNGRMKAAIAKLICGFSAQYTKEVNMEVSIATRWFRNL